MMFRHQNLGTNLVMILSKYSTIFQKGYYETVFHDCSQHILYADNGAEPKYIKRFALAIY